MNPDSSAPEPFGAAEQLDATPTPAPPARILLVDDEPGLRTAEIGRAHV